jgi:20S proteasome subunit alpha 6
MLRVDHPSAFLSRRAPSCGSEQVHTADFGFLEGIHHADMGGVGHRIHNIDGTAHSQSHVDICDHISSVKTDNPQSAPPEAGEKMVSVAPDAHDAANACDGSPAGVAEVNGTDAPASIPTAAPKQRKVASPVPDGERMTAPSPPDLSQIDEHVDVSASSAQNEPFVTPESASPVSVSVFDALLISGSVPHPDPFTNSEEQSANCIGNPDMQVPDIYPESKPLEALPSFASTVLYFDPQETASCSDDGVATLNGTQVDEEASAQDKLPAGDVEQEHFPEPPASPTPNTIPSPPNHDEPSRPSLKSAEKDEGTPSANRLSISYAGGNKRLVINAEVVDTLKIFRHEGRIEVNVNVDKEGDEGLKGILVSILDVHFCLRISTHCYQIESLSDSTKSYLPISTLSSSESDLTLPPFAKVSLPSTLHVVVYLDTERPLSEPKWAKSGDIQEWLKSMFGRVFSAADSWDKKILVVDPDPVRIPISIFLAGLLIVLASLLRSGLCSKAGLTTRLLALVMNANGSSRHT